MARAYRAQITSSIALGVAATLAAAAGATITGRVVDAETDQPIEGASVHLQADLGGPVATSDQLGAFVLAVSPSGAVKVTAGVAYDRLAARNWTTGGVFATNGSDIEITLEPLPDLDSLSYQPIKAATPGGCGDCHAGQLAEWSLSAHAGAATDEWVLDLYSGSGTPGGAAGYVYTDLHPGETGTCATCHAPVAEAHAPGTAFLDQVSGSAPLEGVTCTACHQLDAVALDPRTLHTVGVDATTWRFPADGPAATHEYVWGPLDDVDYPFMQASHAPMVATSLFCASCHDYDNQETGVPGQTTYREWLASPWAVPGPGLRTCQDCHMSAASEPGPIATPAVGSAPTRPAAQRHSHRIEGSTPEGLAAAIDLGTEVSIAAGRVHVTATVANLGAGHSFPTGISIRNAILVVEARLEGEPLAQTSGPVVPWWADDGEPGVAAGDLAGQPGVGFAKILQGEIGGVQVAPVLFVEADSVLEDSRLLAGASREAALTFDLPRDASAGETVEVVARLLFRKAFRALALTKDWQTAPDGSPIELEVARVERAEDLDSDDLPLFADGFESGTTAQWSASVP